MITHMCIDIRGAIWNQSFDGLRHADGRPMTRREAFEALCDELARGHEVLPMSRCDNFDYKRGCLGHVEDPDTGELKPVGKCQDCRGLGYTEFQPTCQLCGVLETEPHTHPVERVSCGACRGTGALSPLAMAVAKARGQYPPDVVLGAMRAHSASGDSK